MNNFKTYQDGLGAEEVNAALILYTLGQTQVTLSLPGDLDNAVFEEGIKKAKFMICELILDDNVIINGSDQIILNSGTSGKAIFRVYPNILPFDQWDLLYWLSSGTVTCTIKKDLGTTTVASNVNNPTDLAALDIEGEYVDFEFTLSSAGAYISEVQLTFTGGE